MLRNNLIKLIWFIVFLGFIQTGFATSTTKHSKTHHVKSVTHKNCAAKSKKKHNSKKAKHHKKKIHTSNRRPNTQPAIIDSESAVQPASTMSFVASIQKRLVDFVQTTVTNLHYSAYKLGGKKFDSSKGVYVVDCSNYVDNILEKVSPDAYFDLVDSTGTEKPTSQHYYDFFTGLSYDNSYWNKVEDVEQLRPGDILVFRYKKHQHANSGHVMVVMNKPIRDTDTFMVSVADSAPVGHSEDTRDPRVSGIGIGTLLLKVNPKTGRPSAYAWKVGSRWEKNVNFAMARPIELLDNSYRNE